MLIHQLARTNVPQNQVAVFWLGQAGFLFKKSDGTLIAVDPYLSDCCERYFGFKRLMPHLIAADELQPDLLVITHAHYDHFDPDAVPQLLAGGGTLLAAADCCAECERLGIPTQEKVRFLRVGDVARVQGSQITAMPCDHGEATPDALGLLLEIDGKRIYIAGDTCLRRDYFASPALQNLDLAILPINGAFGNMNETEAAEAASLIRPALTLPCHFWNFAEHGGTPGVFAEEMQKRGLPYRLLSMGGHMLL